LRGEPICPPLHVCIVGHLFLLVHDRSIRLAVPGHDVPYLMTDQERYPTRFVMLVREKHDRAALTDACESLETRSGQQVNRHDGNSSLPQVLEEIV